VLLPTADWRLPTFFSASRSALFAMQTNKLIKNKT